MSRRLVNALDSSPPMGDLIERLKQAAKIWGPGIRSSGTAELRDILLESAAEIEHLKGEIQKIRDLACGAYEVDETASLALGRAGVIALFALHPELKPSN